MARDNTNSKKKPLLDFIFVYLAYTLRYVYLLVLIPFYGRVLGNEGYAVVLSAMSLMNFAWIFTGWGFPQAGVRSLSTQSSSRYGQTFGAHFSARLILGVVALAGSMVMIHSSPLLSAHLPAAYLALTLGILSAFNLGWYFSGSNRPRHAVSLEMLGFVISLGLILTLVSEPSDATYAILSLLISGIIVTGVAHFWIRKEFSFRDLFQISAGFSLIRSAGYLFLYASSAMLVSAISTYVVGLFSSTAVVGEYGAADRLVALGISVMSPLGMVLIPKITSLHANNPRAAYHLSKKVLLILLAISVSGALISFVFAEPVVTLIFGKNFIGTAPVLRWFSLIFPINALIIFIGTYVLIPLEQEKALANSVILGVLLFTVISIPLTMRYQSIGMASARLIGDAFILFLLIVVCLRNDRISMFLKAHRKAA